MPQPTNAQLKTEIKKIWKALEDLKDEFHNYVSGEQGYQRGLREAKGGDNKKLVGDLTKIILVALVIIYIIVSNSDVDLGKILGA